MSRLETETRNLYAAKGAQPRGEGARAKAIELCSFQTNFYDTVNKWWTDPTSADTTTDIDERHRALLTKIRFSEDSVIIVAGHSLLFRGLFRNFASRELQDRQQQFGELKMPNCGVVKAELNFSCPAGTVDGCISSLELLFGAQLVQPRSFSPSPMKKRPKRAHPVL